MTERATVLFTPEGFGSTGLTRLWLHKGGSPAPVPRARLIEQDRSATRFFRALWDQAFPSREPLPYGPISNAAGQGTGEFWDVFDP